MILKHLDVIPQTDPHDTAINRTRSLAKFPSTPPVLAYIETPFLSVTAVVADAVLKA